MSKHVPNPLVGKWFLNRDNSVNHIRSLVAPGYFLIWSAATQREKVWSTAQLLGFDVFDSAEAAHSIQGSR